MKKLSESGVGECTSCGAKTIEVAVYADYETGKERHCCRLCLFKTPWVYEDQTRLLLETIIYAANIIRMDSNKP